MLVDLAFAYSYLKSKFRWKSEQGKSFFISATINKRYPVIKPDIQIKSLELKADILKELELMIFLQLTVSDEKFDRVKNMQPLFLVAYDEEVPIGFKLGYVIPTTRTFFSWLGGVHKNYRQQGIAQQLLEIQEDHARSQSMEKIYFTTYNRFPAMIQLGKKNNYILVKSELDREEMKYWYEKMLSPLKWGNDAALAPNHTFPCLKGRLS